MAINAQNIARPLSPAVAGSGITITNGVISSSNPVYVAGDGIDISAGVISATVGPASVVLDNAITNPATITDFSGTYIVPAGATGAWAGQTNKLALSEDNGATWTFTTPAVSARRQVTQGVNAGSVYRWTGTAWTAATATVQPIGSVLQTRMYFGVENVSSGTATDIVITSPTFMPVSASSWLAVEFSCGYSLGGFGADTFESYLRQGTTVLQTHRQRFDSGGAGGGTRSGVLLPIKARYTNTSTAGKAFNLRVLRTAGDDTLTWLGSMACQITEIQRT